MQRYLLDTQVLIWALTSPSRLSADIINLLSRNSIFVSHISLLEIAIKQKIGKLPELPISVNDLEKIILTDVWVDALVHSAHSCLQCHSTTRSTPRSV